MNDLTMNDLLSRQASQLEELLPVLMRRLYSLSADKTDNELPVAQLRVLTILQGGPRTVSALSLELGICFSAISQIADRLERDGMVQRMVGARDRRTRYVGLTMYGAETMLARREVRVRRAALALAQLTEPEREAAILAVGMLLRAANATKLTTAAKPAEKIA